MHDRTSAPLPDFIYGTAWKEQRTAALTELAIRSGFRAIDTANQRKHYVEAAVGDALAVLFREGVVRREDLFLQTKFTYLPGQDHRLPYDPRSKPADQVAQSFASSLEHLHSDYIDSYVLHGPSASVWTRMDAEVWDAMVKERDAGRTRQLGLSNVSLRHLQQMTAQHERPAFVQNRCFAQLGWDYAIREFCREHNIVYQGFSLLTANVDVVHSDYVAQIASRRNATPAQIIFAFARQIGILPLTGTSTEQHMREDLASREVVLSDEEVDHIQRIAI